MFPRFADPRGPVPAPMMARTSMLLTLALAAPLLLAACGDARRSAPPPTTSAMNPEPASTASLPKGAAVGEELTLTCSSAMPCQVEFQIDDIRVSPVCEHGRSDYHSPVGEGDLLITVEGEAIAARTVDGEHFHLFRRPGFEDAAGPIEDAGVTSPCNSSGRDKWTHPLPEGEPRSLGQTWVMPAHAEYMILGRHRFAVPELR